MHVFKIWRYYFFEFQHDVLILIDYQNLNRFMITISLSQRQIRWIQKLFKYYFKINYRSKTKNSTNELFKRSNFMISTNANFEKNRIVLKQLQNLLKRKQIDSFATIVRTFSILTKSTKRRTNQSSIASSKTFEKWKILMYDIEIMIEIFERNFHINDVMINEQAYHCKSNNNLMNLTRQMLFNDKYATHIRKKLIIFSKVLIYEKWKNKRKVLWHEKCLYIFESFRIDVIFANHDDF